MEEYIKLKEKHLNNYFRLNRQYKLISVLRLFTAACFLVFLFYLFKTESSILLTGVLITFFSFIFFMKIHRKTSFKREIENILIDINKDEIKYLSKEGIPFADGREYDNLAHPYSHDLDIFGKDSLFQNLNRTSTYIGKEKLAKLLLSKLPNDKIILNQKAIEELSPKIRWRQCLFALAKSTEDKKEVYGRLIHWTKIKDDKLPVFLTLSSYVSPLLLIFSLLCHYFTDSNLFIVAAVGLFFINLFVVMTQLKKLKKEILGSDKVHDIIKSYSLIIEAIEGEHFEIAKLNSLKNQLVCKSGTASYQVRKLSTLYSNLHSIQNPLGSFIFNGFFLYHIHNLKALLAWKKEYSDQIPQWLDVIGEFEVLNSFANFSFNNPSFAFPHLNTNQKIAFQELGHPLIKAETRVVNTVEFDTHHFIILTGSNMAGKSTFLRTLGINMVLAGVGAPVCASFADINPLEILASMRLSDSLSDSESYFYAEVKRLKEIMDRLDEKVCFVLLDEILRGTNSDDKRSGTIEVIRKMVAKGALGVIATHDLEVCLTTDAYPEVLVNKCFEVETDVKDLKFDYKLRNGISKSKSATFIMEKMGVI